MGSNPLYYLADNQIKNLDTDQNNNDPFQFTAFAVQVQFPENGQIVFHHLESVFDLPEARLRFQYPCQPAVHAVEVFVFPGQIGAVEDKKVLDDSVFGIERTADEPQHVFPADADAAPSFHLGSEMLHFVQEFMGALGIEIERDGVGNVQHGNFYHVFRNGGRFQQIEAEMEILTGSEHDLEVVAEFFRQRVFDKRLEENQVLTHIGIAHVRKYDRPVIESIKITVAIDAVEQFGRGVRQQSARIGFFEAFQVKLFGDVECDDLHIGGGWR